MSVCEKLSVFNAHALISFVQIYMNVNRNSETRMTATVLNQDPNTQKVNRDAYLI